MNKIIVLLTMCIGITSCDSGGGNDGGGGNNPGPGTGTGPTPVVVERGQNFVTFETGQVRPLAKSPDGTKLFVLNTPNGSLEIFNISATGLTLNSSVPVGMEPTAVAALSDSIVWVVNHLSDSVSIVDVSGTPKVIQTLLVGDEPRDIIFAGTANKFAFITAAHRGQNAPDDNFRDPQLTTASIGRADVWVFDTANPGNTIGGDPVNVISLFGDTPRALAKSPDGMSVYAAVFFSGNKTTTLGENDITKASPIVDSNSIQQPDTGLIVQFKNNDWFDAENQMSANFSGVLTAYKDKIPFSLPDYDVFTIDASLVIPAEKPNSEFSGVGTTLFNMVTSFNGTVYVSNTNALNLTRFEGTRENDPTISTVRGHFVESQITVLDITNKTVTPVHLNDHIIYSNASGTPEERDKAISQPVDMAITPDGKTLYVAGFGTKNIVVYDTAKLDAGISDQLTNPQIKLSAGGPSGVIHDAVNNKLYVLTRFDNGISTIDIKNNANIEVSHFTMYNPEPKKVVDGREFLYNATLTSSHGDSSCGLCHVYGDFDSLAWDLGDPTGSVAQNPNKFVNPLLKPAGTAFHPMKGPMTTQSLRGLKGNGPMHWRGDRTGETRVAGESVELRAFKDFNVAIKGLVGNDTVLSDAEMNSFAKFALELTYPPNPIRNLNNILTADQETGRLVFLNDGTTANGLLKCNDCHVVDIANKHFGTAGKSTLEGDQISQEFKVPHLRNMYQKVGKFGNSGKFSTDMTIYGPQIRGFGYMTDGGMDTLDKFIQGDVFRTDLAGQFKITKKKREQIVDFIMVMDSELLPIVGQQITLTSTNATVVSSRIDLLIAQAKLTTPREECDLIVKGVIGPL